MAIVIEARGEQGGVPKVVERWGDPDATKGVVAASFDNSKRNPVRFWFIELFIHFLSFKMSLFVCLIIHSSYWQFLILLLEFWFYFLSLLVTPSDDNAFLSRSLLLVHKILIWLTWNF